MDPLTLLNLLAGGLSIAGGLLGEGEKATPNQQKQGQVIDQLLQSLKGNGPYSELFNADDKTFQESFVDPAKSMFQNQIAPQIQQSYIAGGQQRGTGLEDTLTRAGVDLDQMLNQNKLAFQQNAQSNQLNALSQILGSGKGAPAPQNIWDKLKGATAGFLTSDAGQNAFGSLADLLKPKAGQTEIVEEERKGFTK